MLDAFIHNWQSYIVDCGMLVDVGKFIFDAGMKKRECCNIDDMLVAKYVESLSKNRAMA